LLASWKVPFEAVDVEAAPGRRRDLERFGIAAVPAVIAGERVVHGWNPEALAALVGVAWQPPPRLDPAELAQRLDRVLAAAERAMRQMPAEHLGMMHPGRHRPVRQLGYHVFHLSATLRKAMTEGRLPKAWLDELAPEALTDGPAIAGYGARVRRELAAWLAEPHAWDRPVETYYGPQTGHQLLERTTWHAAQHLRQLYAFLGRMGVTPEAPLTDTDYAGLPLPSEIW
jgi:DinB family protein